MFSFYSDMGLRGSTFFDSDTFGADKLVVGFGRRTIRESVHETPLSDQAKLDAVRLYETNENYFEGLSAEETREKLSHMSYKDYLLNVVKVDPDVLKLFRSSMYGTFVVGPDAIPAIFYRDSGYPGFDGLDIEDLPRNLLVNEPGGAHGRENAERAGEGDPSMYFPDGNATITRLLVRSLVPGAVTGNSMEDITTAAVSYNRLDNANNDCRIRLNSMVTEVRHLSEQQVQTTYVLNGKGYSVKSKNVIMACWNTVIPYICPEIPAPQKSALSYGKKSPLMYCGVLVSNWRPFVEAGVSRISAPGLLFADTSLQASLNTGDYATNRDPDQPIVVRMGAYFDEPDKGLSRREQHLAGRRKMLATSFDEFEFQMRDKLTRALGSFGFDDERDILGLTVNRWPHGYAYSYNPLSDPDEWAYSTTPERPAIVGRERHGRIAIANSDAAASPHTDAAINEAYRAVTEIVESGG